MKLDGRTVEHDVVRSVNSFITIYLVIFAFSILIISLDEKDLVTNFTAVAATLNNIGPGMEIVGPAGNFQSFSTLLQICFDVFDMLAGRLELLANAGVCLCLPRGRRNMSEKKAERRRRLCATKS